MARWLKLTSEKKRDLIDSLGCTVPEIVPTQQMRQERFDNWELTDDHGMHIYGVAKDQNGKEYYMVQNSWGETGDYKGTWYMTKAFIAANTMDFLINKKAIPAAIRKKLGPVSVYYSNSKVGIASVTLSSSKLRYHLKPSSSSVMPSP